MIHVEMRSSDVENTLEHLRRIPNFDNDCGIAIMIKKIEKAVKNG
jgi:hypothetical protein